MYYDRKHDILSRIKKRAEKRGLPFDLDVTWLSIKLAFGHCEATGLPFKESPASMKKIYILFVEHFLKLMTTMP